MDSAANASGANYEGEEQGDPSSIDVGVDGSDADVIVQSQLDQVRDVSNALRSALRRVHEVESNDLEAFRQQWQRELEARGPMLRERAAAVQLLSVEEKAKIHFQNGVELERRGQWYEAIRQYKRAMILVPDIEQQLYETTMNDEAPQARAEVAAAAAPANVNNGNGGGLMAAGEDLVTRFLRLRARRGVAIAPAEPAESTHISALPYEVLQTVLRWVVSSHLDLASLERAGAACRALLLAARDPELWRRACVRTWGSEVRSPRALGFPSWRAMFALRPRLQLHGCYISKTTYLRHGENSFQDQFYRPWFVIEYYRYLRFFPEGTVLSWTTAEEPAACVPQLRWRGARPALGVLAGHYRLIGDKVVVVIKTSGANKPSQPSAPRPRARRRDPEPEPEPDHSQTFHMELQLSSTRARPHGALAWVRYRVGRRDVWTDFELTPRAYPPFSFSRVRAYTREAHAPL